MATVTVDQQRLVLNSFGAILENALVAADAFEWDLESGEMDDRNALTVSEQRDPSYAVVETTDGVADLSAGVQGTVFGSEQYKINKTFNVSMGYGDFAAIRDLGDVRRSRALKRCATNLAEKIDAYALRVASAAPNNWTGTPGNLIDDTDEVMSAYTRLKEGGVSDEDLTAILTFADKQALGDQVLNLAGPGGEAQKALRVGFEGNIGGIPTRFTQQLANLTTGTRVGSIKINGANQNVDYADVAVSAAPGQYKTQTIAIDGLTNATDTIKAGEVFTISGVYAYDNRKGAAVSPARLQEFTVVADATAATNAVAALRIYPAIIVPGSGSGDDVNINTAHATVTAAPADNADITFKGSASTAYTPRLLVQKDSMVIKTKDLVLPMTGQAMRRRLQKVPLSVRMWQHSDFNTGAHSVRFDVALTANISDRDRMTKLNGS